MKILNDPHFENVKNIYGSKSHPFSKLQIRSEKHKQNSRRKGNVYFLLYFSGPKPISGIMTLYNKAANHDL